MDRRPDNTVDAVFLGRLLWGYGGTSMWFGRWLMDAST